ncbi:MAG: metallophosphoesterase [Bacteroidales bacterium]|nr:metallophosphoesterase [Bacteroidales bacterium]
MKIIHLSDLHIGHKDCGERFHTIIRNIAVRMKPAGDYVVVITGDLADNANKPEQREKAARSIEELEDQGYRVLAIPGNHDYGTGTIGNIRNVRLFKERFYRDSDITFPKLDIIHGAAFIGLDSTAEELNWHDRILAQGELGREQLGRLEKIINDPAISKMMKVVYLHHHPFDFKIGRQLKDSRYLKKIIENRIDLLLFGHYHRSKQGALKVHHGTWGIPRCYNAGTATHKNGNYGFHRVIGLSGSDPAMDYDGEFQR